MEPGIARIIQEAIPQSMLSFRAKSLYCLPARGTRPSDTLLERTGTKHRCQKEMDRA
jgi:hypothetical protein